MGGWDTVRLLLQMVAALAVVLLVMWLAARLVRSVGQVRNEQLLELVARQQVGRTASVAVVRVADQALVVGVTEQEVSLLAEVELEQVQQAQAAQEQALAARRERRQTMLPGQLTNAISTEQGESKNRWHGSILSASTWKQAVEVLRDRTSRRG